MRRSYPLWVWSVFAGLALGTARAAWPEIWPDEVLCRSRTLRVEHDPRGMCLRELRQLPGVGTKLALVLASTRDEALARGEPLAWEDVPGIGEVRAREIRAWCRSRGIAPDPLCAGRRPAEVAGYPDGVEKLPFGMGVCVIAFLAACGEANAKREPVDADAKGADAPSPAPVASVQPRTLALQGGALHALAAGPSEGALVLLLHGARYSARNWQELGTLERLARAGYHALAIDWPGFGSTPSWSGEPDASTLLTAVCDELGAARAVLVAPSMSGRFAFDFLGTSPERVAGLVAIAPADADRFQPEHWDTPCLLLWGEKDEVVPLERGRALAGRLPGARLETFPGAAHACYLDQPERFHALLLEFLGTAIPRDVKPGR